MIFLFAPAASRLLLTVKRYSATVDERRSGDSSVTPYDSDIAILRLLLYRFIIMGDATLTRHVQQ